MTLITIVGVGLLIGLSLGALGGGGSILTVPALVYVLHEPARGAITESLVIVGITAMVAATGHARAGHVRWGAGLVFGLAGIGATYAGSAASRAANPNLLLLAFAALIATAATTMLIRPRRAEPSGPINASRQLSPVRSAGTTTLVVDLSINTAVGQLTTVTLAKVITVGLAVGFLTGFFGVGGGFVIVPALVMVMGYEMSPAIGTSLLIIAINSAVALLARAGHETFHWSMILPFTIAAVGGSLAGKGVSDRLAPATLTKAFITLLFAVAIYVAIHSAVALRG
jgi:uncharacterized membrane protein YfcA